MPIGSPHASAREPKSVKQVFSTALFDSFIPFYRTSISSPKPSGLILILAFLSIYSTSSQPLTLTFQSLPAGSKSFKTFALRCFDMSSLGKQSSRLAAPPLAAISKAASPFTYLPLKVPFGKTVTFVNSSSTSFKVESFILVKKALI